MHWFVRTVRNDSGKPVLLSLVEYPSRRTAAASMRGLGRCTVVRDQDRCTYTVYVSG